MKRQVFTHKTHIRIDVNACDFSSFANYLYDHSVFLCDPTSKAKRKENAANECEKDRKKLKYQQVDLVIDCDYWLHPHAHYKCQLVINV